MKMFTKESYDLTNLGDDTVITVGDKITRSSEFDSTPWRVETVTGHHPVSGSKVSSEYLIKRLLA